jgi:hypothetical protein
MWASSAGQGRATIRSSLNSPTIVQAARATSQRRRAPRLRFVATNQDERAPVDSDGRARSLPENRKSCYIPGVMDVAMYMASGFKSAWASNWALLGQFHAGQSLAVSRRNELLARCGHKLLKSLNLRKENAWIFLPYVWIFLPRTWKTFPLTLETLPLLPGGARSRRVASASSRLAPRHLRPEQRDLGR